jgi:hypothetical protein
MEVCPPEELAYQAGLALLTFGFYIGREHARRGYNTPMGQTDRTLGLVPDDLSSLEQ